MLTHNTTNLAGQQIGNYEVEELLASRKVSSFYLARDVKLEREVFLEVLQVTAEEDPDLVGRFQRRIDAVSQLKHPNIAALIESGETNDGYAYAVIEYVPGPTLAEKIDEWNRSNRQLTVEEALKLSRQIADALSVAHPAGLIHHDLRPDNLIMSADGRPELVDLCVPIVVESPDAVLSNKQAEMLDYASPEENEGKAISRRSNIYSMGIITYELLTGHRPRLPASSWDIFERATMPKEVPLEEAREGLSGETYRLVRNCLWRQEWSRFETADELITAIDTAILAEETMPKTTIWSGQRRSWLYIAIPVLAVIVVALLFLLFRGQMTSVDQGGGAESTAVAGGDGSGSAAQDLTTPTSTATATATATREPPPTSAAQNTFEIAGPLRDSDFTEDDDILFSWVWLAPLSENQAFSIYVQPEDSGGDPLLIGSLDAPEGSSLYRLQRSVAELGLEAGFYTWQVQLIDTNTDRVIAESNPERFVIVATATATPTATATLAVLNTPTPTAAPTSSVCVPQRPAGWVEHVVQPGENPSTFADAANIPVEYLLQVNCLDNPRQLSIGQRIFIPAPPATNTPTPAPVVPTAPSSGGGSGGGGNSGGGSQNTPTVRPSSTPPPPPG